MNLVLWGLAMPYRPLVLFQLLLASTLTLMAQQQRYSTKQGASAKKPGSRTERIKNATEFTSDGDFLKQTAQDNAFVLEIIKRVRDQGSAGDTRNTTGELVFGETRLGDDLRKLAGKKHVTLPDKLNQMESVAGADPLLIDHALVRYQQEITCFQTEAEQGSDSDIKKWASNGIETLQRHQQMLQTLKGKLNRPAP